jgi:hypothetical protein
MKKVFRTKKFAKSSDENGNKIARKKLYSAFRIVNILRVFKFKWFIVMIMDNCFYIYLVYNESRDANEKKSFFQSFAIKNVTYT